MKHLKKEKISSKRSKRSPLESLVNNLIINEKFRPRLLRLKRLKGKQKDHHCYTRFSFYRLLKQELLENL